MHSTSNRSTEDVHQDRELRGFLVMAWPFQYMVLGLQEKLIS